MLKELLDRKQNQQGSEGKSRRLIGGRPAAGLPNGIVLIKNVKVIHPVRATQP